MLRRLLAREGFRPQDYPERWSESWDKKTTATTADQEIGSYAFDSPYEDLVITSITVEVFFTTLSTTAALLGELEIQVDDETALGPWEASNTSSGALFGFPLPLPDWRFHGHKKNTVKAVCTPATATEIRWLITLIGYKVREAAR